MRISPPAQRIGIVAASDEASSHQYCQRCHQRRQTPFLFVFKCLTNENAGQLQSTPPGCCLINEGANMASGGANEKTPQRNCWGNRCNPAYTGYSYYNICFHIKMRGSSVARIWSCYIFAVPFALAVGTWIRTENKHSESRDVLKPGWSYLSSTGQLSYRLKMQ